MSEASFLGSFVEDVGHRTASSVTVTSAWADCGVVAETIEDLAAHGTSVCLDPGRGRGGDVEVPLG